MRVAIMQPYFFPYIGYFSLIKHTSAFILLDDVQFIRHGWIERNRILKPSNGWQYISVPLIKESHKSIIKDVKINNSIDWRRKLIAQLNHYNRAAYYDNVIKVLNEALEFECDDITSLNKRCLEAVCRYLRFDTDIRVFSEMNLNIDTVYAPDEWALNICKALGGVTEYWNPPGGITFFDANKFHQADISISFQQVSLQEYRQKRDLFEPGLSIIDVMMFNSIESINTMLDRYTLL